MLGSAMSQQMSSEGAGPYGVREEEPGALSKGFEEGAVSVPTSGIRGTKFHMTMGWILPFLAVEVNADSFRSACRHVQVGISGLLAERTNATKNTPSASETRGINLCTTLTLSVPKGNTSLGRH